LDQQQKVLQTGAMGVEGFSEVMKILVVTFIKAIASGFP
jgi:hypothetical protein